MRKTSIHYEERRRVLWFGVGVVALLFLVYVALRVVPRLPHEEPVSRSYDDFLWLRQESVTVSATGVAGSATGSAETDRRVAGYIYAVHIDFAAGITDTTDIALTQSSPRVVKR